MLNRYTKGQIVGFITLVIIGIISLFILIKVFSKVATPKENILNEDIKNEGFRINVKGDLVTYVDINSKYKDDGAKAYDKNNENISSKIITTYHYKNRRVSKIDTSLTDSYLVKYEVESNGKSREAYRIVIITDNKAPKLIMPEKTTIHSNEVLNYDVKKDIKVSDNSGQYSLKCENTLKEEVKSYVIKCTAKDESDNTASGSRIIKVIK